ncbi:hypothetical protein CWE15_01295 [Aliidiomarina taiwanensis]|uniref:Bacteriophage CI repressor n=1 Tax=Aliidiomarina taiwanensis TaxID=946228 RepID=A0A432X9E5_9GAMM|nr:hypothetical protein [Aliidiomarina taiwanensis]RUO43861.1 hypothetical protein CWE15_01295 [Aliidiomarina taiwanensis]
MKNKQNKPQLTSEIKSVYIDLDQAMERLALLAGTQRPTEIMRWMGLGSSTYTNWKRNNSVPYRTIVCTLLDKGISLDAFFSPKSRLKVPDELVLAERSTHYDEESYQDDIIRAAIESKKFLERAGLPEKELYIKFLVDIWMLSRGEILADHGVQNALVEHFNRLEASAAG